MGRELWLVNRARKKGQGDPERVRGDAGGRRADTGTRQPGAPSGLPLCCDLSEAGIDRESGAERLDPGADCGFGEAEFRLIGEYIVEVLDGLREANSDDGNAEVEAAVRTKVAALCARFPIYPGL